MLANRLPIVAYSYSRMRYRILFVDDDRYFSRLYKENLEAVFDVVVCHDAERAVEQFRLDEKLVAAVVDVMLPPPVGHEAECQDGYTTGIWILEQCQDIIHKRRISLLLFTNRGSSGVKEEIKNLAFDARITEVCWKISVSATHLAAKVNQLIAKR